MTPKAQRGRTQRLRLFVTYFDALGAQVPRASRGLFYETAAAARARLRS